MLSITLYIPCYNASKFLEKVLPAVFTQSYTISELLIIDDGSTDNTVSLSEVLLQDCPFNSRVVKQDKNQGLSAARNRAILECKTEWLASLDADCVPDKDWLKNLVNNISDNTVGGVGGMLVELNKETPPDLWRDTHLRQELGNKKIINPTFLFGHSNLFKLATLKDVGGYDIKHKTNGEDFFISQSIKQINQKLIYEPNAITYHLRTDTVESIINTFWRYQLHGIQQLDQKTLDINSNVKYYFQRLKYCVFRFSIYFVFLIKWILIDIINFRFQLIPINIKCILVSSKKDWKLIFKDIRQ